MEMNKTDLCETRWEVSGQPNIQGNTLVYSGGKKRPGGIGVLDQHTRQSLLSHDCVSERILTVTSSKFMP